MLSGCFAEPDCLANVVVFPIAGLVIGLTDCFPATSCPPRAGVAAGVRTLDAEAAVGFERSVVNFRLGFSTEGGGRAFALVRASDAAVGAYSPDEGVLGRAWDEGVMERAVDVGVRTREGVIESGCLGVADTRFLAASEAVDCPVSCGFKGAMDLTGVAVEGFTADLAAGDLNDELKPVVVGLI